MAALNKTLAVLFAGIMCVVVFELSMVGVVRENFFKVVQAVADTGSRHDTASRPQRNKSELQRLERYLSKRAIRMDSVNCKAVIDGDTEEVQKAYQVERQKPLGLENDTTIKLAASSCATFVERYGFINDSLTDMEEAFPLAYSILTYKAAAQVVYLLRAIYRPQNSYCIHVDRKSRSTFRDAIKAVTQCLPGVMMASRAIDVRWGSFTVLEPELVCMEDLWNSNRTWRYFINLTGQEFPLKTNYELVRILQVMNGANDVHGFNPNYAFQGRWRSRLPAPHNLTVYAGGVHVTLSRAFVDFLLHNRVARDFRNWTRRTGHPDENYFNTLNYNPQLQAPGGYKGSLRVKTVHSGRSYITRWKNWVQVSGVPCPGKKVVRQLCIFSALDIPFLSKRRDFFANKFYHDYSRVALGCLGEEIYNRTRDEALGRREFNVSYYENMPQIKYKMTF